MPSNSVACKPLRLFDKPLSLSRSLAALRPASAADVFLIGWWLAPLMSKSRSSQICTSVYFDDGCTVLYTPKNVSMLVFRKL